MLAVSCVAIVSHVFDLTEVLFS